MSNWEKDNDWNTIFEAEDAVTANRIPVDFEQLAKLPPGNGYPHSIRAEDLMKNFAWCDLLPSKRTDSIRIELKEEPGETQRHLQRRLVVVGQAGSNHPWKVTLSASDDGSGSLWDVKGGEVYSESEIQIVADTQANIGTGYIYLRIERDATSREMMGAQILSSDAIPTSTSIYQYFPLAVVGFGEAMQLWFSEVRLRELLLVENGAFQLMPFHVASRNSYDLPP